MKRISVPSSILLLIIFLVACSSPTGSLAGRLCVSYEIQLASVLSGALLNLPTDVLVPESRCDEPVADFPLVAREVNVSGREREQIIYVFNGADKPEFTQLPEDVHVARTDADGRFAFDELPEGEHVINYYFLTQVANPAMAQATCEEKGVAPDSQFCLILIRDLEATTTYACDLAMTVLVEPEQDKRALTMVEPLRVDVIQLASEDKAVTLSCRALPGDS